MARMRNWTSALFLVPLGLLTSHAASATPPAAAAPASTPATLVERLPPGIHRAYGGRYTQDLCDHTKPHYCFSHVLLPVGWTPDQPVPPKHRYGGGGEGVGGMSPADVVSAYKIPSSTSANGKIVAVLDSPDSNAYTDLSNYRSEFGLPALPKCSGNPTGKLPACFAQVSESGGPSTGGDSGEDGDSETSLDMQMVSAACPDCSILLVEIGDSEGNFSDDDFVTGAKTAASLGAVATSISIGGPEGAGPNGEGGQDPLGYTTPGHLVLSASGDFGYDLVDEGAGVSTPSYPSSAPDVLAVGGTMLFNNVSNYTEAVWNDANFGGGFSTGQNGQDVTTSGCSVEFKAPTWQLTGLAGTGCANRATVDVSAAAAFVYSGQLEDIAIYQGGWQSVEGTSASSPMMAGILTRLGLTDQISNNLGWVYSNPTAWNDLGSTAYPSDPKGSDTDSPSPSSCGKLCTVAAGWDGPSGMGTANGAKLAALAGDPVNPPPSDDAGAPDDDDAGTTPPPGSGTGTSTPPPGSGTGTGGTTTDTTPAPGSLGATCAGPTDCASGLCAEPMTGQAAVCTETCTTTSCPTGYSCTIAGHNAEDQPAGYCFASGPILPPVLPPVDGGAGDDDTPGSSGSTGGGCSVAHDDSSPSAGILGLAFGLAFAASRRRRRA